MTAGMAQGRIGRDRLRASSFRSHSFFLGFNLLREVKGVAELHGIHFQGTGVQ